MSIFEPADHLTKCSICEYRFPRTDKLALIQHLLEHILEEVHEQRMMPIDVNKLMTIEVSKHD